MADEGNSVLSQDAIDSLFGAIPAGDPVVDPGTSPDGVTRASTVGDMPEQAAAAGVPPAVAAAPAPAPVAAPVAPPAQQMPDARPWLQEPPATPAPAAGPATTATPPMAPPPPALPAPAAPAQAPVDPAFAAAPAPAAAPLPVAPVAAGISGDDVEAMIAPLQASLAIYDERFAGINAALARLTDIEGKLSELERASGAGVERRDLHLLQGRIMKQMRSVVDNLQATPAYGLRKTFACSGCGEVGYVAVRVKCTSCDRETHVGWFPREPEAGHGPPAGRGGRSNPRVRPASSGRRSRRARPGQGRAPR